MPKCKMFHVKHSQTKHKLNVVNHPKCRPNVKQVSRNTASQEKNSRSTVAPGRSQIRIHAPNSRRPGMSQLRDTNKKLIAKACGDESVYTNDDIKNNRKIFRLSQKFHMKHFLTGYKFTTKTNPRISIRSQSNLANNLLRMR